jgi:hypothetical protein
MLATWISALIACHGADPDWDLTALQSWRLADLPAPQLIVRATAGDAPALEVVLDADLPCPIPLARAVTARVGDREMTAIPGDLYGTGVGRACQQPAFVLPLAAVPDAPAVDLTLEDGQTRWTLTLARPTAARTLTPVAPTVHAGATLAAAVGPPEDRWIPDSARAAAVTVRLTARSAPPDATCVTEHEGPLGAAPPAAIPLSVPADFCPGPAWLSLSGSQRRSAVRACPPGVGCRFEMSGFLAPIDVLPPVEAPTTPLPSPPI